MPELITLKTTGQTTAMTFPIDRSLSTNRLFDQLDRDRDWVILCATNRIARNLRSTFDQRQIGRGETIWPTPQTSTVDDWLGGMGEQISLLGEVPIEAIPDRVLSPFQERMIWKQSIEAVSKDDPALPLFDLHSLARTATEAHALASTWHLHITGDGGSEETRQFIAWRKRFKETCQKYNWADVTEYQQRILGWLKRDAGKLPPRVVLAGFDTLSPHLSELLAVLTKRNVEIFNLEFSTNTTPTLRAIACDDAETECRAAAAWSRKILAAKPGARIGIVVADLEARRATIAPILDEALNPDALACADDSSPRQYNVSLGLPLTRYALVRTAMALLRLLGSPKGLALTEFGDLLRMPYWSADQSEADMRALVDAKLRERPGQNLNINAVLRVVATLDKGSHSKLHHHLSLLEDAQQKLQKSRRPGEWAIVFRETLIKAGWPGERGLSSTEFQTRAAFFEVLATFAELDVFLGSVSIAAASGEFARLCRERVFQPKTIGQPAVQVLGLIEAKGSEFDALWVMGMNDQHWPPPARPNPLLSAELQRRQQTPGSCAEVQARFALGIHQRLLHSAPDIIFSYAEKEGERELRPSPLITQLLETVTRADSILASGIFGHVGSENHHAAAFDYLDDHLAPPVAEGEKVSGGSGLLRAQAICPAWAFYQYRLGAKKLETPTEGLDASQRGTMVHTMLEMFWKEIKDSPSFLALSEAQLQEAVAAAAEFALAQFEVDQGEKLSATFRQLEAHRLRRLCLEWLAAERGDPAPPDSRQPFRVVACEEKHTVTLGRLRVNLVIDRVDELIEDGRRIVLDYKTGSTLDTHNWFGDSRITEPQLPLYAAIVLAQPEQPPVAAVAFAKIRMRECKFQGIAAEGGLLPGVGGLRSPPSAMNGEEGGDVLAEGEAMITGTKTSEGAGVPDDAWQALLDSWKNRIEAIADEIQRGEAAVRFENKSSLAYCDVLPLLRLSERRLQFEKCREVQP